jgi:hypothetical protein
LLISCAFDHFQAGKSFSRKRDDQLAIQDNLETQYDEVIGYIRGYLEYVLTIIDRSGLKKTSAGKARLKLTIDPFNLPAKLQDQVPKVATEEEKQHEYYQAMISRDQASKFSVEMLEKFPRVRFDLLSKFNTLKQPDISMFDSSHLTGIAFAMVGGLFQFMPRLLFEYPVLDLIGFLCYITAMVIIYPRWTRHGIERKQHQYEKYILTFAALVQGTAMGAGPVDSES